MPKTDEKKMTNKECAIRLVLQNLARLDIGVSRNEVEELLGSRTTQGRVDKIYNEVMKQKARCEKLFAAYLEGRG